jgi:hypothetical protein
MVSHPGYPKFFPSKIRIFNTAFTPTPQEKPLTATPALPNVPQKLTEFNM